MKADTVVLPIGGLDTLLVTRLIAPSTRGIRLSASIRRTLPRHLACLRP